MAGEFRRLVEAAVAHVHFLVHGINAVRRGDERGVDAPDVPSAQKAINSQTLTLGHVEIASSDLLAGHRHEAPVIRDGWL
jgi:hypothetical protein